jgi:hypothetical protein
VLPSGWKPYVPSYPDSRSVTTVIPPKLCCLELQCSTSMLFASRPTILSQACEFIHVMLNMTLSSWTPMIRSHSKYLGVTWKQSTVKETMGLGLGLKRGPQYFQHSGAWIHWCWHQWVRGHWYETVACSNNQTRIYKNACLLRGDSEGEAEVFALPECSAWYFHLQGFMYHHKYCWILEMMQMAGLQFQRKCLILNLPFVCKISHFL